MANLKIAGESETQFKNNTMIALEAGFVTNTILPEAIGLASRWQGGLERL